MTPNGHSPVSSAYRTPTRSRTSRLSGRAAAAGVAWPDAATSMPVPTTRTRPSEARTTWRGPSRPWCSWRDAAVRSDPAASTAIRSASCSDTFPARAAASCPVTHSSTTYPLPASTPTP